MMKRTSVCVFCGSSSGKKPHHSETAARLGKRIATDGYALVYGGGGVGLMGDVARAALEAGGAVRGVMPKSLRGQELPPDHGCPLELTDTMQQRKRRMLDLSDAFIVLPGGVGTMDEFFEIITEATLGLLPKPIVLVDDDGYYTPLISFLHHMVDGGFVRAEQLELIHTVKTADEAMDWLNTRLAQRVPSDVAKPANSEDTPLRVEGGA